MFVDSHCHLNDPELRPHLEDIRAAMAQAQVDRALCICTTMEEFPDVHRLALDHDNFWASVGVHPETEGMAEPSVDELVRLARLPRVVAVGETGLDYFQMDERKGGRAVADLERQRTRFRTHIRAARAARRPLVIHTRSASEDTLALLREAARTAARAARAGCSTASPRPWRPWRSRALRSTWVFTSRCRASSPSRRRRSCATWRPSCRSIAC